MLALEYPASEVLKDLDDTSPTLYQDIWTALARRFGEVDEARESMKKFETRKQEDGETLAEFEQALRTLYRIGWPGATQEQRELALKTRFEDGLLNQDMSQYLRLHARDDNFAETVMEAKRFAMASEQPKTRKSVRILSPSNNMKSDTSHKCCDLPLYDEIKELKDMIHCISSNKSSDTKFPQPQRKGKPFTNSNNTQPKLRPEQERNGTMPSPTLRQQNGNIRHTYMPQFSGQRPDTPQNTTNNANQQSRGQRRTFARRRGRCWVCNQVGCHTDRHRGESPSPAQRYEPPPCWTCGYPGCHSRYHTGTNRTSTPPILSQQSYQGNSQGTWQPGTQRPNSPARPNLR